MHTANAECQSGDGMKSMFNHFETCNKMVWRKCPHAQRKSLTREATSAGRTPSPCMACTSVMPTPSINSMVSNFEVLHCQYIFGNAIFDASCGDIVAKLCAHCSQFFASLTKSSSCKTWTNLLQNWQHPLYRNWRPVDLIAEQTFLLHLISFIIFK